MCVWCVCGVRVECVMVSVCVVGVECVCGVKLCLGIGGKMDGEGGRGMEDIYNVVNRMAHGEKTPQRVSLQESEAAVSVCVE